MEEKIPFFFSGRRAHRKLTGSERAGGEQERDLAVCALLSIATKKHDNKNCFNFSGQDLNRKQICSVHGHTTSVLYVRSFIEWQKSFLLFLHLLDGLLPHMRERRGRRVVGAPPPVALPTCIGTAGALRILQLSSSFCAM